MPRRRRVTLKLDHKALVDYEVQTRFSYGVPLIAHTDGHLSGEADTAQHQLDAKCLFVHGLQKAWAEQTVHLDRCSDHTMSKSVEIPSGLVALLLLGVLGALAVHSPLSTHPCGELLEKTGRSLR